MLNTIKKTSVKLQKSDDRGWAGDTAGLHSDSDTRMALDPNWISSVVAWNDIITPCMYSIA